MQIAIVGGGIVGLSLALNLHKRGLDCTVYEAAPEVKELGVGITLLPHAMRELTALGVGDRLKAVGIANEESCFFNRFGQLIYQEPRGVKAGYQHPEIGIHRGKLHKTLWDEATARLGDVKLRTNHKCVAFTQDSEKATLKFSETTSGSELAPVEADLVVACDGVNSAIRKAILPAEDVVFTGINTWRGVTRHKPILTGKSYIRVGSINTAKIVIYPIVDNIDGRGNQLINWTTEIKEQTRARNDWNKPGNIADFISRYEDWTFDWMDIPAMIRNADVVFEYPMVDKDPIHQWCYGRVALAGDAAHPMYPRGSNGSAQGLIDSRVLADALASSGANWESAFKSYEAERVEKVANIVRTNRSTPPDFINIKVEEITNDQPFDDLDRFISQDELRAISERYKNIAGFSAGNAL